MENIEYINNECDGFNIKMNPEKELSASDLIDLNDNYSSNRKPYSELDKRDEEFLLQQLILLSKTQLAGMGQVVESSSTKSIVGTHSLDTCYGILFYHRDRKEGCCGHAIPGGLVGVMVQMLNWAKERTGTIEYMILPGYRNVERHDCSGFEELKDFMFESAPRGVSFKPLENGVNYRKDPSTLSFEFAFDAETGQYVTNHLFGDVSEFDPRYNAPKLR